jgi:exopolysaccharide biosynthesis polyprenyl glycosylphosphotransferase
MSAVDAGQTPDLVSEALGSPIDAARARFAISIRERRVLLAAVDFIVGALACFLAFALLHEGRVGNLPAFETLLYGSAWVLALFAVDGYAFQIPASRIQSAIAVIKALPIALLIAVLTFFLQPYVLTRPVIVLALAVGAALLVLMRTTLARLLLHESLAVRAVLLSDSPPSEEVMSTLRAARFECRVVAKVMAPVAEEQDRARLIEHLRGLLDSWGVHELIVTNNEIRLLPALVEECVTRGIRVVSASSLVERYMGRVPIASIDVHWYLGLPENDLWERPYAVVRRLADLVLALVISLPFLALLPLIALLIKIESRGPVFHVQRRVGEHGKEFNLLKLRTMNHDAEAAGAQFTALRDARVTRIGRLLRATRLDEVPQLLNIVRGEMSFIGPRPERPEFIALLESEVPHFHSRLLVKPGLTGWAQVRGGYASTIAEMTRKLEYDLYYIKNRSLRLDMQILASTFVTVIRRRGR